MKVKEEIYVKSLTICILAVHFILRVISICACKQINYIEIQSSHTYCCTEFSVSCELLRKMKTWGFL